MPQRDSLIARLAKHVVISGARWDGDDQTIVHFDRLVPSLAAAPAPGDPEDIGPDRVRYRMLTARKPTKIFPPPARTDVMAKFHAADAGKGRRLLIRDLDAGHIAALASWHFEHGPKASSRRSRRKTVAPHLVTSMSVRHEAEGGARGEYTVMLWFLLLLVAAIDRRTVQRNRVGVRTDAPVILTEDEIAVFGLVKGPARRHGGHADRNYYELRL